MDYSRFEKPPYPMKLKQQAQKQQYARKHKLRDCEIVALTEECSAIIQKKLPPKFQDLGSFNIPITIGNTNVGRELCDLGASINLIPLSICKALGISELKPTMVSLQLADRSTRRPSGIIGDVLVKVDKFIFLADFIVLDMEAESEIPLLLGRPFLATARALIDVEQGKLELRMNDEKITINVLKAMTNSSDLSDCFRLDVIEEVVQEMLHKKGENFEVLEKKEYDPVPLAPKVELKELPKTLKYAFLGDEEQFPVIISKDLSSTEEKKLLKVLKEHKTAIGWSISDFKGINPSFCTHKILMEDNVKPVRQPQRRLNPTMKEVVCKEVMKLMDAGMIYPISDTAWVSPVQTVPKQGGLTVVKNDQNELIPTRTITGWRMFVDYRRLNDATIKDHFPLPSIDQMLERLAGHAYYCFLDGYSGYNQIPVAPEDQEKIAFTYPFGVFAYRRMPFVLCNALATFQ
ncbi:uncharacterized protein LOC133310038, partial [Gastrolobium bilobum]|uniref:uncharacterized protein LOC133310038 n=1 Tax=Gastrolobium bilobum TaxID=150636 RepID=UPI002AB289EF